MEKEREIANKIVDEFEEFLAYKHIDIPNPDKADAENPAILYGADYYGLEDRVTDIINREFATWTMTQTVCFRRIRNECNTQC